MLETFRKKTEELSGKENPQLLLAVSGGIDSMVLAHLVKETGFQAEIAHVNFQLRGEDSDGDADLVEAFARENKFTFHLKQADTSLFAQENGVSIQEAARTIRYAWFKQVLSQSPHLDVVVTAHNQDDHLETFLINTLRGSGANGLAGIPEVNGKIIRPMLDFSRKRIEEYAASAQVIFREDSSNAKDDYLRNRIRHLVMPALREADENFPAGMLRTMRHMKQTGIFVKESARKWWLDNTRQKDGLIYIPKKLIEEGDAHLLLFEALRHFGFNETQVQEVVSLTNAISGKMVVAGEYAITADREDLILAEVNSAEAASRQWQLIGDKGIIEEGWKMKWEVQDIRDVILSVGRNEVVLDMTRLKFPLHLRPWRQGDFFKPLGMQGKKKISDLLVDAKVPVPLKSRVMVLCSGEEILWVVGFQISDDHKVKPSTRRVLHLTWNP